MTKKRIALAVCLCLLAVLFAGCSAGGTADKPLGRFEATDEIFTYEKPDADKTQLVVAKVGSVGIDGLVDCFEAENPDAQIIMLDITGGNDYACPSAEWIRNGDVPDVVFARSNFVRGVEGYFEDLSAYPFIKDYTAESLFDNTYDGQVKFLPGASQIEGMCYNVTLFERYGWEIPRNAEEFIALCKRIEADTGGEVKAWNPNAKYPNNFIGALQAIIYADTLSTADDRLWLNDFVNGKATFAGHMEPLYDLIKRLADEGLLREEHFTYSATTRYNEFMEGKIVLYNNYSDAVFGKDGDYREASDYQFGLFPYPTTETDEGLLLVTYSYLCGVPKAEHTDAERKVIDRFLAFISSAKAQDILMREGMLVSNLSNHEGGMNLADYENAEKAAQAFADGRVFTVKDFRLQGVGDGFFPLQLLRTQALRMTKGEMTAAEAIQEMDATVKGYFAGTIADPAPAVVATVPENMTILETSEYMADMFRDTTGADIALIPNNSVYRGNVMKIYAGDFTEHKLGVIKPRSYANDAVLTKATMTGEKLLELLHIVPYYETTCDAIYAFSGLKATIAPWRSVGEKYASVTLADGTAIDKDAAYTVAFWAGSVPDRYISGAAQTYAGTFEELLRAYMEKSGKVTSPNDGRITLIWD